VTPSDLAHVTTAAEKLGRSVEGCAFLRLVAVKSTPHLAAIARAALQRAASDGSTWASLSLDVLAEADAVPRRVP